MVKEEYARVLRGGQEVDRGDPSGSDDRHSGHRPRLAVSLLVLTVLSGCLAGRDSPPPPPPAVVDLLGDGDPRVSFVVPGLTYYDFRAVREPWAVHLLRADLSRCGLGFEVLEAPVSGGEGRGRSRVTELLRAAGTDVLAAVNGDFFTPEGLPLGTEVVDGRTRQVRARPALAWRPGMHPWVGIPAFDEDSILTLGWPLSRAEGDDVTQVVGGFPILLKEGRRVGDLEASARPSFAAERHPRTAVGFDADDDLLWIVVIDGRQPEHSAGMTLPELAALLEALGVEEAINLDGGGSSIMVLNGEAVSRPSDAEGERPVANALAVRWDPASCAPAR